MEVDLRSTLMKRNRRQSRVAETPFPESATTSTRPSGEISSPAMTGMRERIQTVAGPGSTKLPVTKRYSTAEW